MIRFLRLTLVLVLVIVLFFVGLFAVDQSRVALVFLGWKTPEWSVFWWLLIAFGLGAFSGTVATSFALLRRRLEQRSLRKRLEKSERELAHLRQSLAEAEAEAEAKTEPEAKAEAETEADAAAAEAQAKAASAPPPNPGRRQHPPNSLFAHPPKAPTTAFPQSPTARWNSSVLTESFMINSVTPLTALFRALRGVVLFATLLSGLALANGPTVNINKADAEQLADVLDGVGLRRAEAIIKHRKANGGFKKAEQLVEVKGIGPYILERNAERIRVRD